jgi:hypothetical protein
MPGCIVDAEHDVGVPCGGVCPAESPQVPRKRGLHVALPGGPLPPQAGSVATLDQACGQAAGEHLEGPKDLDAIMTLQVAHPRALPFAPSGRPPGGNP